jgi:hypothetical protein
VDHSNGGGVLDKMFLTIQKPENRNFLINASEELKMELVSAKKFNELYRESNDHFSYEYLIIADVWHLVLGTQINLHQYRASEFRA